MKRKTAKKIFIVGYESLNNNEKKEADKIIKKLRKSGHKLSIGI